MGIYGLTGLVQHNQHLLLNRCKLRDCAVVIDAGALLWAGLSAGHQVDTLCGGDYDALYEVYYSMLHSLIQCNVTVTLVFDGPLDSLRLKHDTTIKRLQEQWNSALKRTGDVFNQSWGVNVLFAGAVLQECCDDLSIKYYTAPGEADPLIVCVANQLRASVISDDSDFYIFPLDYGYIPLKTIDLTNVQVLADFKYLECEHYNQTSLLRAVPGLRSNLLSAFSCLVGNDYISAEAFAPVLCTALQQTTTDCALQAGWLVPVPFGIAIETPRAGARQEYLVRVLNWLASTQHTNSMTLITHVVTGRSNANSLSSLCSRSDLLDSDDESYSNSPSLHPAANMSDNDLVSVCERSVRVFSLCLITNTNHNTCANQSVTRTQPDIDPITQLVHAHFEAVSCPLHVSRLPCFAWTIALQQQLMLRPVFFDPANGAQHKQKGSAVGAYDCVQRLLGLLCTLVTHNTNTRITLLGLSAQFKVARQRVECVNLPDEIPPANVSLLNRQQRIALLLRMLVPELELLSVDWLNTHFPARIHLWVLTVVYVVHYHIVLEADVYALCMFVCANVPGVLDNETHATQLAALIQAYNVQPYHHTNNTPSNRQLINNFGTEYEDELSVAFSWSCAHRLNQFIVCLYTIQQLNAVLDAVPQLHSVHNMFSGRAVHNLVQDALNVSHGRQQRVHDRMLYLLDKHHISACAQSIQTFMAAFDLLTNHKHKSQRNTHKSAIKKEGNMKEKKHKHNTCSGRRTSDTLKLTGNRFDALQD